MKCETCKCGAGKATSTCSDLSLWDLALDNKTVNSGPVLTLACSLVMALHSPAAPRPEGQEGAAEDNADPMTAQVVAHTCTAQKPEISIQQQTAVANEQRASNVSSGVSRPASQPVMLPVTHIGPEKANAATLLLGSNSSQASEETPAVDNAAKPETSTPSALDVVCADVRGVLTLDFKSMRCFVHYKGVLQQQQSFDAEPAIAFYSCSLCTSQHPSRELLQGRT